MLKADERILAVNRRLFEQDPPRFFVGVVSNCENGVVEAAGYTFARDAATGKLTRKSDERTRILSIASDSLLVFKLPDGLVIESLAVVSRGMQSFLTDRDKFNMDVSEWVESSIG